MFNFGSNKIHYNPFRSKSKTPKSLSLTIFYPLQNIYTRGWKIKKTFVYLNLNLKSYNNIHGKNH